MKPRTTLTVTSLLGTTAEMLDNAGYRKVEEVSDPFWQAAGARVFEDKLGIVAVLVYDTWKDLVEGWQSAQAHLVSLISHHLSSGEPKAWDGYLVLLTPSPLSTEVELNKIRYDVTRLRKIVATGDELSSTSDLERVIAPLLPIEGSLISTANGTILSRLPGMLAEQDIPEEDTRAVIGAFMRQESLVEKLDDSRRNG
jgi:hypothetical protein